MFYSEIANNWQFCYTILMSFFEILKGIWQNYVKFDVRMY